MDISSVPAFQRPMDASENDQLVGEDDAGNPMYRTILGNTYIVRRSSDQRTTRTKIEEDVLPAVREYLADPTAPTADQAIAAAKAIAGDAWETISIPGDLLSGEKGASDVTLGEVFELTGGTAAASTMFDVPGGRDTLRIFGGARAKYPPNMTGYGSIDSTFNAEADFKTLENLSVDFENDPTGSLVRVMDELERNPSKYPATLKEVVAGNWFRGRDDLMRFEIDDSQSEILGNGVGDIVRMDEDDMDAYLRGFSFDVDNKFPDNSIQGMPEEQAFSTLGNILKHDELYNQYPQLRDAPVIEDTAYFKRNPNVLGYFDDSSGTIAINTNKITTNEELRDTLLHEVQHLVQHLEGFESGTNVRNADVLEIKKAIEGSPEYQKAFVDYNAKVSKYLENRDSATVAVYNKNKEVASKVLDIILDDFSNKTQIPVEEIYERLNKGETFDSIKMSVSPDIRARGFVYPPEFERILHIAEGNVGGMAPSSSVDLNRSLDDVNPRESAAPYFEMLSGKDKIDLIADNNRWQQNRLYSTISSLIKDNPELAKDFENSLGFSAQDFIDASRSQDSIGKLYGIPNVVPPTKPKIVRNYVIYSTKRGEVEARNVSARKDMAASERTPENVFDTEDTPANRQWGEPELKKARSGQNPVTGFANGPSTQAPRQFAEGGSIRPKLRPEGFANATSPKPRLRPSEDEVRYVDAVFRGEDGDIITAPEENNPVTMLGLTDGNTFRQYPNNLNIYGAYLKPSDTAEGGPHKSKLQELYAREKPDSPPLLINDILIAGEEGVKNRYTAAHEFMHRGFNVLRNNHNFDEVSERFGRATAQILFSEDSDLEHALVQSILEKEGKIAGIDYTSKDYLKGVSEKTRDKLKKSVEDIYELSNETLGEAGYQTDRDRGPTTRQGRRGAKPKSFWSFITEKLGFAEGGTVDMNQQMSFAFEDGGLRDDGMRKDPVSGNEVPSGSMANEVRDDIPAQLSEGEYVVPADVVRYYGVKFFEDIRDRAKMGLRDMEARGRIGGEPVPAGGPQNEDLSPEEMAIVREAMGMSQGGQVSGYNQGGSQPNATSGQVEQNFLTLGQAAQQNPYMGQPLGFSFAKPAPAPAAAPAAPATQTQEPQRQFPINMLDPTTGNIVPATNEEQYQNLLSQGYIVAPKPTGNDGGNTPPPTKTEPWKDWVAATDWTSEDGIRKFVNGLEEPVSKDEVNKKAIAAGILGGPVAGLATGLGASRGSLQNISDLNAARLIAKAQGMNDLAAELDARVKTMIEEGPGILDFLDDIFATGKQKANAWAKTQGFESIEAATKAGVTPKVTPKPTDTTPKFDPNKPKPKPSTYDNDKPTFAGESLSDVVTAANKVAGKTKPDGTGGAVSSTITDPGTAKQKVSGGTQAEQDYVTSAAAGNKGGLMNKAALKKKAKRQYKKGGLANKK